MRGSKRNSGVCNASPASFQALVASEWHEFKRQFQNSLPSASSLPNARGADAAADQRAALADGEPGCAGAGTRPGGTGADLNSFGNRTPPLSTYLILGGSKPIRAR